MGIATNPSGSASGVLGRGPNNGVAGLSDEGIGVFGGQGDPNTLTPGTLLSSFSGRAGVFGASENGPGVIGYSVDDKIPAIYAFGGFTSDAITGSGRLAGLFRGDVQVEGDIFLPGADCAEHFDIIAGDQVEPGDVVVINEAGALRQSYEAYDRKVAGVISGAGACRPGVVLAKQEPSANRLPVSLVGKVFCKVDAKYSSIEVGDLLTSSATPGHAMKATDPDRAFGAVIGKALRPWHDGRGLIPILIALG